MKPIKLRDGEHLNAEIAQSVNLPVVKDKNGDYCIFSKYKDEDGDYRESGCHDTLEKAKKYIGRYCGEEIGELNRFIQEENWEIVDWIIQENEPMERVIVMDNAEEECGKNKIDWNKNKEKLVGKEVEVAYNYGWFCDVCSKDRGSLYLFPKTCLIPVIPEKEEVEELTMEEVCKELGRTIKIKK